MSLFNSLTILAVVFLVVNFGWIIFSYLISIFFSFGGMKVLSSWRNISSIFHNYLLVTCCAHFIYQNTSGIDKVLLFTFGFVTYFFFTVITFSKAAIEMHRLPEANETLFHIRMPVLWISYLYYMYLMFDSKLSNSQHVRLIINFIDTLEETRIFGVILKVSGSVFMIYILYVGLSSVVKKMFKSKIRLEH